MPRGEIVSLCFRGFPGTNRHLREISRVTGLTRHLVVSTADGAAIEITFLRDHLATLAPRCVIFGSWHAVYEPLVEAARAAAAEVAVLWTSDAAQTEFSGETATLASLLGDRRVARFFAASSDMLNPLAATGRPSHLLPHPSSLVGSPGGLDKPHGHTPIVSLFCGPNEYRRKNALACILAVAGLDAPYVLHLNGLSERPEYRGILDELGVSYIDHGWMDESDYAHALDEVDVGLQVSLADSFNYVVAEHFARAIPVVVSRSIPCAHGLPTEVERLLVVADPDDPAAIRAKLRFLLTEPEARRAAGSATRRHIERLNAHNIEAVVETLTNVLAERE